MKLNQVPEVPDAIFLLLSHKPSKKCQAQGSTAPSLLVIIRCFRLAQDIHTSKVDFHTVDKDVHFFRTHIAEYQNWNFLICLSNIPEQNF